MHPNLVLLILKVRAEVESEKSILYTAALVANVWKAEI